MLQTYKQIIGLTYTEGAFARTEAQEELLDRQLVAPTSQGGMGFKSMQEVAPMCHVAAHFLAAPLVATATGLENYTACVRKPSAELCEVELDLKHALELIQDEVVGEEEDPNALDLWQCTVDRLVGATTEAVPGMQKQLIEDASTRLLVGQTPHAAGRIICLGGKYATAWFRAVPSDFKYTMSSEEFQVASLATHDARPVSKCFDRHRNVLRFPPHAARRAASVHEALHEDYSGWKQRQWNCRETQHDGANICSSGHGGRVPCDH